MYIKTPKRYSQRGGRRGFISLKRILFWIVSVGLIVIGVGVYENREMLQDDVSRWIDDVAGDVGGQIREVRATAAPPTEDPTLNLQRAEEAWRRGAIQESVDLYEGVIDAVPNDLNTHYKLALGLLMEGHFDEALSAAEDTITSRPYAPDAWSIRAMALNRLGRYGEAVASASRAIELLSQQNTGEASQMAPSKARAQAFLAEAYLNLGQVERAQLTIEDALEAYPDSFEALQVSGMINWTGIFDLNAARRDLQAAYDIAPNMIYVAIWLARLERDGFDNDDIAVNLYEDIIEQNPGNTLALFDLGDYYLRDDGNFNEALSYLSRCVEVDSRDDACHYLLGRTQMRLEQFIDAQNSFQIAFNLSDKQNGYYYYWLAESHILLGQCPQALPLLQTGYQIAQEAADDVLIESFEFSLQECGSPVIPLTPQAETTPEVDTSDV
jgi:tetratricopeptide (TPR) repeat protein